MILRRPVVVGLENARAVVVDVLDAAALREASSALLLVERLHGEDRLVSSLCLGLGVLLAEGLHLLG